MEVNFEEKKRVKIVKKRKSKAIYVILVILFLFILGVFIFSMFLLSKFEVGDFVFKRYENREIMIGEVGGVAFPMDFVVKWQDGSITDESLFNIKKLSELEDFEIKNIIESGEKEGYDIYNVDELGVVVSEGGNVSRVSAIIPGKGAGEFSLMIGDKDCVVRFVCGNWGECQTEYDLLTLVNEGLVLGVQYRYCRDTKGCYADFIDSKKCDAKEEIEIKKVTLDGEDYIEIYDSKGKLIGNLKESYVENNKKLDIGFII